MLSTHTNIEGAIAPNNGEILKSGTKNTNALFNIKNPRPTIIPRNKLLPIPPLRISLNTNGTAKMSITAVAKGVTIFDQKASS